MNWGGFPVAFRFPVQDFSWETRKRCWSYVLPALAYADLTDSTLREAQSAELFDPDQLIYIALVAPTAIPPSRKNSLLWRKDGRLMSQLALFTPVVQENFLELYTEPKILADIDPDRREELYEKDEGLYLKMLPLSPGGEGAVYTAAAFQRARLFSEMISDVSGEAHRCLFGVLPGRKLVIDGFTVPDIDAPLQESYGLGRAIKIARERGFTDIRLCARGLSVPASDAKALEDLEELYSLSRLLPLYDQVILTQYDENGHIQTETIDINRRNKACVSSILSKRSGTAEN